MNNNYSLGYRLLGVAIFAGMPALIAGAMAALLSPVGGIVIAVLIFLCALGAMRPRHDRGESW